MWEQDHKQGRTCKNWCFWTVVLQKTLESHSRFLRVTWKSRRSNQSILKEIILFGRTEAPILWPPDANNRLIGKDPDTGKDWRQKKTAAEYEMLGWHYWLNGHELGQTLEDGEGQGNLVCCTPWDHKKSNTTGWLNNNNIPVPQTYLVHSRYSINNYENSKLWYFKTIFTHGTYLENRKKMRHIYSVSSLNLLPKIVSSWRL